MDLHSNFILIVQKKLKYYIWMGSLWVCNKVGTWFAEGDALTIQPIAPFNNLALIKRIECTMSSLISYGLLTGERARRALAERHAFSCERGHVSPSRAVLSGWSGVACSDLTPYAQHRARWIFRTYAEPQHVALHMANRGKCYVISCHAWLLLGRDMETNWSRTCKSRQP